MEQAAKHNLKTIITALLALITIGASAQIKVEVSETVELMGILSRTAGFEEFSNDLAGQYSKDTEAWFSKYREHPTVAYYQNLRAKQGIGYERVTNMAIHLDIEKGKVKFIGDLAELKNNGWQNVDLDGFLKHLNKFYADTRFHDFFEQHKSFYDAFLKEYDSNVMGYIHPEWYSRFYNGTEQTEQFRLIIGFTYGTNNNGASRQLPNRSREVFAVCGYNKNPLTGQLLFDTSLPLHEFNHAYVNPLLDKVENAKAMQEVGQKLFQLSKSAMEQQHYNDWHIVINESLVRAAVIVYFHEHGINQFAKNMLTIEMGNGFPWMRDVVTALIYYDAHRDQYPTISSFYPEIARCLSKYLDKETERMSKP